jgi:hypothetical protein
MRLTPLAAAVGLLSSIITSAPVVAAPTVEDPACTMMADQIVDQLKTLSLLGAEGTLETSAVRQSAREAKKNGVLSTINIGLTQMTAGGCKPFPLPVRDDLFKDAATLCVFSDRAAQVKANAAAAWAAYDAGKHVSDENAPHQPVPECDRSAWKSDRP